MLAMGDAVPEVLQQVRVSWAAFIFTFVMLVGLLFVRRLLPPDRRRRGRIALILLALSIILRLAAVATDALGRDPAVLNFLSILLMAFGITGVVALLAFDIGLARTRVSIPELVRDIVQVFAFAIITIAVLQYAGVNLFGLITTSAVLTAIIGLALQSTISNLFAGLTLQVERNINVGDWIQLGDHVGRVVAIKWRSTLMVTKGGDLVVLPNASLLGNDVQNFSRPTSAHRMILQMGFHYRHPPGDVKRMLLEAVRGVGGILAEPPPDAFPVDFGDRAVTYALRFWIDEFRRDEVIEGEVRTRVWYAAQRRRIEIPFPVRTVYLNQVTDEQSARRAEREEAERGRALERTELFATLEPADRALLARSMRAVRFSPGELIIRQGEAGDSLYLIQEGEVAVRLAVEGVEREVASLGAGQFFGEMSLMTGEPRRATCAASTEVVCYVIDYAAFQRVLAVKPQIAEEVSRVLGERESELEGERENL
jgi:small-conductance mechanosensitive channel